MEGQEDEEDWIGENFVVYGTLDQRLTKGNGSSGEECNAILFQTRTQSLFMGERRLNTYILIDVLLCSIAEYFYELCRILASP